MLEQKKPQDEKDGEVVYRRISPGEGEEPQKPDPNKRRRLSLTSHLAPTLKTVIVGFALLLTLVILLGYLSVRKTNEVGRKILDDERRHVAIRQFVLDLRLATTKLDNEARARGRRLGEITEETRPLFDAPLNKARDEVNKLMLRLAAPPYSESEKWRNLLAHLISFLQATQDPDTYLREGYVKFRDADKELDDLLEEMRSEQDQIFYSSEELERSGARWIYLMWGVVVLMGARVAAYT